MKMAAVPTWPTLYANAGVVIDATWSTSGLAGESPGARRRVALNRMSIAITARSRGCLICINAFDRRASEAGHPNPVADA